MKIRILLSLLSLTSVTFAMEEDNYFRKNYSTAGRNTTESEAQNLAKNNSYVGPIFNSKDDIKLFLDLVVNVLENQTGRISSNYNKPFIGEPEKTIAKPFFNLKQIAESKELTIAELRYLAEFNYENHSRLFDLSERGFYIERNNLDIVKITKEQVQRIIYILRPYVIMDLSSYRPGDIRENSAPVSRKNVTSWPKIGDEMSIITEESENQTAMSVYHQAISAVVEDENYEAESNKSDDRKQTYGQGLNSDQNPFSKNKGQPDNNPTLKMLKKDSIYQDNDSSQDVPVTRKTFKEMLEEKLENLLGNSRSISKGKLKRYNSAVLNIAMEVRRKESLNRIRDKSSCSKGLTIDKSRDKSSGSKELTIKQRGSHINISTSQGRIALWNVHGNRGVSARHVERLATRGLRDSSLNQSTDKILEKTVTRQNSIKKDGEKSKKTSSKEIKSKKDKQS